MSVIRSCIICSAPFDQSISNITLTRQGEATLKIADNSDEFELIQDNLRLDKPYTLSWQLTLPASATAPMEYQLSAFAAFEFYWDGQRIGSSGQQQSTAQDEIPGSIENTFVIAKTLLTTGTHTLSINASSQYRQPGMKLIRHIRLMPFGTMRFISIGSLVPTLFLSASFIIGCYFLLLFSTETTNKAHLYFAASCLLFIDDNSASHATSSCG